MTLTEQEDRISKTDLFIRTGDERYAKQMRLENVSKRIDRQIANIQCWSCSRDYEEEEEEEEEDMCSALNDAVSCKRRLLHMEMRKRRSTVSVGWSGPYLFQALLYEDR
jgi:hypothetical protein